MLVVPDSRPWRVPGTMKTLPSHGRQLGPEQGSSIFTRPFTYQNSNNWTANQPLQDHHWNNTYSTISGPATVIHTKQPFQDHLQLIQWQIHLEHLRYGSLQHSSFGSTQIFFWYRRPGICMGTILLKSYRLSTNPGHWPRKRGWDQERLEADQNDVHRWWQTSITSTCR